MRIVIWIVVAVIGLLAALTLDPELPGRIVPPLEGLSGIAPIAQVVALKGWLVLTLAVIGVLFVGIGLVRRQLIQAGTAIMVLGGILVVVAIGHLAIMFDRGTSAATEISRTDDTAAAPDAALTILTVNMEEGDVEPSDLSAPIVDQGVDVVVLPEMLEENATALAAELTESGHPFTAYGAGSATEDRGATAVLLADSLGGYVPVDAEPTAEAFALRPVSGVGPTIVAVHPTAPRPDEMDVWRQEVEQALTWCRTGSGPVVVAGGLNATVDHAPARDLGRCVDGAQEAGLGGVATWPANIPWFFGSPIDRILVDEASYRVAEGAVFDVGRATHRALVVRVEPVG
ncbi:endonuclease/exonuclease/phosphatase family protein [Georgenia sp. Z1344]|uniref:endonuclease/exonuclease/phosphatase family protein n=1 Tax=Georgenia sp. Z1344 TaxID=3416706 RepID=UPI003CE733AF